VLPVDEPLPETKAALYERFTRYFYEWKQEQHIDLTQQDELIDELHEALGKLALAGINSAARFRLGRKLARQQMGERLFNLACRLGWLNLVDRDAKTDEAVYAFFHPTFQEYFAACAIDDWDYFLKHVPDNPMQGNYRIFERQWKEVILLWLGRNNVPPDKKEVFIWKLLTFEDKCQGFYWVRAYFVAAEGIAEFSFSFADGVLALIIQYGFGFDIEKETWTPYFELFEKDAISRLKKTDCRKAVKALTKLLEVIDKLDLNGYWELDRSEIANWHRHKVCENLYEISSDSYQSTITLLKLIQTSRDNFIREIATKTLGKFENSNLAFVRIVSKVLLKLIENSKDEDVIQEAVKSLGKIAVGEQKVISVLTNLLNKYNKKNELALEIANSLIKINPHDSNAISTFFYFLLTPQKQNFLEMVVNILIEVGKNNTELIEPLSYLLESSNKQESILLLYIAKILSKIDIGNLNKPIEVLIHLLDNATNEVIILKSAEVLLEINVHQSKIVNALEKILKSSENIQVLLGTARLLGKIDPGNLEAINTLIELVYSCTPVASSYLEYMSLGKMKSTAIKALNKVMEVHEDELMRIWGAKSLGKIDTGNLRSVQTLLYFLKNGKEETIQDAAAKSLTSLLHKEQLKLMIHEIRDYLNQVRKSDSKSYNICQKVVWHCSKNLSYPDFFDIWDKKSTNFV
jgi:HEAT repeat protein